jgi:hypothetical protein
MSEASKKQLKRLIRKYEFLLEDWEEVDEINKTANMEMSSELHKHMPPEIKASDFESEWDEDEEQESPERDVALKKLFRKIVVKCHPDRMPSDLSEVRTLELIDLYEKAVEAHSDQNWAMMVIVAIKLEIDLPEEAEERIDDIKKETKDLEKKINNTTSGIAWQWYHSEEEAREKLINNYLSILKKSKEVGPVEIKKAKSKKGSKLILGVGHPRTGTGYTSKLLQSWGLDVGHEKMGKDGTVDWSLAASKKSLWQDVDFREWEWQHIIYCVRDPRKSIPSIAYTENIDKSSEKFRKEMGVTLTSSKIGDAIMSIILWDEFITSLNPGLVYRIEDESENLFNYLKNQDVNVKWSDDIIGKPQNTRKHKNWIELVKESSYVGNLYKKKINAYCAKYGYSLLF